MNEIKSKEIDISVLQKLRNQGTQSTIYTDGNICYKFLDGFDPDEKKNLHRKFLDMQEIKIDGVLLPEDLIVENGLLQGYTMAYFKNSTPLLDKFLKRYFNCKELFEYINKASKILRNIHSNGIICQDLSFKNILVDTDGNVAFCDIDGCSYKENDSPFISFLFKEFFLDYRKSKLYIKEDVDNLSMILWLYLTAYGETLQRITKKQYNSLSNNIKTFQNLRKVANVLVDKKSTIENIPYLDEFIDLNDDYIIDREKTLNLRQKIFRKI